MPTNMSVGRILVPLDGSPLAETILPLVEVGGHPWGSDVLLIRSLPTDASPEPTAEKEAFYYLAAQARRLERAGLRVRYEVWHGDPSQTIINAAVLGRVTLIAMTTHGWRGLDRLRFGSVAEAVVRKARVPVLLLRGPLRWPADRPPRILVPLDGSKQSVAILALITRLRHPLQPVVELCHVLETPTPIASPDLWPSVPALPDPEAATHYLERVATRLARGGFGVERVVLEGLPAPTIAKRIADSGVDLVAMTTHGRSGIARFLMGSVAEEVLRTADVPVLLWKVPVPEVVRGPEHQTEEARHAS